MLERKLMDQIRQGKPTYCLHLYSVESSIHLCRVIEENLCMFPIGVVEEFRKNAVVIKK